MTRGSDPARRHGLAALICSLAAAGVLAAAAVESPVADAAMRGQLDTVRALIAQHADVNAPQGDGMTALHWAARRGDLLMTTTLLDAGALENPTTRLGAYSPLHLASERGHVEVIAALLDAGANPRTATTSGGATPLHFVAAAGNAEAVALLVDRGADPNAREAVRAQTPLMFAAAANRTAAIRALVERGADVGLTSVAIDINVRNAADRADEQRRDARRAAARANNTAARGMGPGSPAGGVQPDAYSAGGAGARPANDEAPAGYAALVGGHGGLTALLHAVREGHFESTSALLDLGANINQVSAGDRTSPILIAIINGHFDLALRLLERGADPTLASDAGATPLYAALNLHWAPKSRYPQPSAYQQQRATYMDVMRTLLEAGVDPNVRLTRHLWYMSFNFDLLSVDTAGATPFWRAAYATDVEAMRLLARYGADPNIPTQKTGDRRRAGDKDPSGLPPVPVGGPGAYPLHAASGLGYGEGYAANAHRHVPDGWLPAVRYLVEELGADVNARDQNGYSPVHHAAARGDDALIGYLVSKGADVTLVSRRGQTTADMANGPVQRVQPFPDTVALLERLGSRNNHRCLSC